ncbi:hypothetical protein KE480_08100 [Enterococcus sp. 079]|nr:hypothetical protein [Enterococcus sp. 079]
MKIAYIRVSSIDQNEQRQIEEMKSLALKKFLSKNNLERRLVIGRFSRKL